MKTSISHMWACSGFLHDGGLQGGHTHVPGWCQWPSRAPPSWDSSRKHPGQTCHQPGRNEGRTWWWAHLRGHTHTHTQMLAGRPASALSRTTVKLTRTLFAHAGVEEAGAETVSLRHTEACVIRVNRNISENLAGRNETETGNPMYTHIRLVQSVQRPVNTKHTLKHAVNQHYNCFYSSSESNKLWVRLTYFQIFIGFVCHYNFPINFNMVSFTRFYICRSLQNCWIVFHVISWLWFRPHLTYIHVTRWKHTYVDVSD